MSKVKAPSFGYANHKSGSLASFQMMENTYGGPGALHLESIVTGSTEPVTPDTGTRMERVVGKNRCYRMSEKPSSSSGLG